MSLLTAILLLVAFYLLLIAEFFLPTSGFLGIAATTALIAAVVIAYGHSASAAISMVGFVLITTPLMVVGLVRLWPHTPIGRRMLNRRPGETTERPQRTTPKGIPLAQLVGQLGLAKTDLLPSGMVTVGQDRIDAVSIGMPIDRGTRIVVTSVEAGKVHVRPATDQDLTPDPAPPPTSPPSLEDSLESFDFE